MFLVFVLLLLFVTGSDEEEDEDEDEETKTGGGGGSRTHGGRAYEAHLNLILPAMKIEKVGGGGG